MKILTAAQLRKLTTVDLDSLYIEVVRIRDAADTSPQELHEAIYYAPRIGKEQIQRMKVQLQTLKDERLIELQRWQAEQRESALAQAQKNLDASLTKLKKLKAKAAKLQEKYEAKYGSSASIKN